MDVLGIKGGSPRPLGRRRIRDRPGVDAGVRRQAGQKLRALADTAKVQLREQMGPDFDDVDWKQYDPRQYDPRRIVREALLGNGSDDGQPDGFKAPSSFKRHDPDKPTPYDQEAT